MDALTEIHLKAKERFTASLEADQRPRDLAEEDLRFVAGEQWDEAIKRQREIEQRPCLTINQLPRFINQVVGDARLNKPAIRVHPVEDGDVEGAEIREGLIRNIESQSDATTAYLTAFELAVKCGMGHWRITTEYADDDVFEQDIRIKRIKDPFSVLWDANAVEYDKSDAEYCFVTSRLTPEAYEARFPGKTATAWQDPFYRDGGWYDGETIRICEYWFKKPVTKLIAQLIDGRVLDMTGQGFTRKELEASDLISKVREVETHEICMVLMDGAQVLEKEYKWAGKHFPIVSVFGPEETTASQTVPLSLIRYAKDPQRLYNYWTTQITEKIALAPKSPFIGTSKQFAKHKKIWQSINRSNRAYIPYTPDAEAPGPPQRDRPADLSVAEIEQRNQATEDLKNTTGLYDAAVGNRSNETSGRAILARQREGDVATFAFHDNLARSIGWTAKILLDLIPRIYDTARMMRVMGEDGTVDLMPINQVFQGKNGEVMLHDLSEGKYDFTVSVGPSFTTRRVEAAESMLAFAQAFPQAVPVIGDLIAKSMDWPLADDIAERLRKTLPPGMVDDEEPSEEQQAMAMQQAELALRGALAELAEQQASAEDKAASARKKHAEAEQTELETDLAGMSLPAAQAFIG